MPLWQPTLSVGILTMLPTQSHTAILWRRQSSGLVGTSARPRTPADPAGMSGGTQTRTAVGTSGGPQARDAAGPSGGTANDNSPDVQASPAGGHQARWGKYQAPHRGVHAGEYLGVCTVGGSSGSGSAGAGCEMDGQRAWTWMSLGEQRVGGGLSDNRMEAWCRLQM
jgi:hypothetical protein|eukprot:7032357-Prymnesium_polylepis.2